MSDGAGRGLVERARDAAARGAWQQAFDLFMEADADGSWARRPAAARRHRLRSGDLDVTIEAWERAYAACLRAGDPVAAAGAAVRVAMHLLFDTALMAPVRGWLARAEQLLEVGVRHRRTRGLRSSAAYERMLTGDLAVLGSGPGGPSRWVRRVIRRRPPSDGWPKPGC